MKLTWKEVFNTGWKWYGDIDRARSTASACGYAYFCWNGRVYRCTGFTTDFVCFESEVQ